MDALLALLFLWTLTWFFARLASTYDSRIHKGKYIVIRNKTIARLFIEKCIDLGRGRQTLKKDRNKMSLFGLIIYSGILFVILLSVILLIVPKVSCEPFLVDSENEFIYTDTVNARISVCLSLSLFSLAVIHMFLCSIRAGLVIEYKWIRVLLNIFCVLMIAICVIGAFVFLIEAFRW